MTFSIVALSPDGGYLGVATATRTLSVGAVVPAAAPRAGALATQAYTNRTFRARVLELLRAGVLPEDVPAILAKEDDRFDRRQLGVVDGEGRSTVWTGPECTPWAGQAVGHGYAIVGNHLVGPQVVAAMEEALLTSTDDSFPRVLLDVLAAGDAAGGDSRGRQSAALYVVANDAADIAPPVAVVDLRVDDHAEPIPELQRLLALWQLEIAAVEERVGAPAQPEERTVGELGG